MTTKMCEPYLDSGSETKPLKIERKKEKKKNSENSQHWLEVWVY